MTKKKILQVQVTQEFYDVLKDIASFENESVSKVVRDLFEKLEPGLREARDVMLAALAMSEKARKLKIPEIVRHGEQLESNVQYGLENIKKALKDKDSDQ